MRVFCLSRFCAFTVALLAGVSVTSERPHSAAALKPLYTFCTELPNCAGGAPAWDLILRDGRFYGMTVFGGTGRLRVGTVFELSLDPSHKRWVKAILYNFCAQGISLTNCPDGATPSRGLTVAPSGTLYGTTQYGGATGGGTVFELTPDPARKSWTHKVVYSFPWLSESSGLIIGPSGNLYVATVSGGAMNGGTLLELTRDASTGMWRASVLYNFCSENPRGPSPKCFDGLSPSARLIMDASGNLYGTTGGGAAGGGTVFELMPDAAKETWNHKILHNFCSPPNCSDGRDPVAGVMMDESGNLYGTTQHGGAKDAGTIFEVIPDATKTKWTEKVLYSLCSQGDAPQRFPRVARNCPDGALPYAGVVMDRSGNLFGTTDVGGAANGGTVFQLKRPASPDAAWVETVLYAFCSQSSCPEGIHSVGNLIIDASGNLYGATRERGPAVAGRPRSGPMLFELERQIR